jgi:hypothetical protein
MRAGLTSRALVWAYILSVAATEYCDSLRSAGPLPSSSPCIQTAGGWQTSTRSVSAPPCARGVLTVVWWWEKRYLYPPWVFDVLLRDLFRPFEWPSARAGWPNCLSFTVHNVSEADAHAIPPQTTHLVLAGHYANSTDRLADFKRGLPHLRRTGLIVLADELGRGDGGGIAHYFQFDFVVRYYHVSRRFAEWNVQRGIYAASEMERVFAWFNQRPVMWAPLGWTRAFSDAWFHQPDLSRAPSSRRGVPPDARTRPRARKHAR